MKFSTHKHQKTRWRDACIVYVRCQWDYFKLFWAWARDDEGHWRRKKPLSFAHTCTRTFPAAEGWWGEFSSLGHMAPARKASAARYVVDDEMYIFGAHSPVLRRVMVVCRFYWSALCSYPHPRARGLNFFYTWLVRHSSLVFCIGAAEAIARRIKIKIGRLFLEIQLTAILDVGETHRRRPFWMRDEMPPRDVKLLLYFALCVCGKGQRPSCAAWMNHAPLLLRTPGSAFIIHRLGMQILVRRDSCMCIAYLSWLRKECYARPGIFCYLCCALERVIGFAI